jgi:hypothetical protein
MYRAGLLAVLLLATTVLAGNATLTCTKVGGYEFNPDYTTGTIQVNFMFKSIAPVFPGSSISFTDIFVYAAANSVKWDEQLKFNVTLEHYIPYQRWGIGQYRCVYNNSGNVEERFYEVVEKIPNRTRTVLTFTVSATAADYSSSASVKVTVPLSGSYCSELPTVDSWPDCPAFEPDPNKVSVDYPGSWRALMVNGYAAGQTVVENGVNATIPKPWNYGIYSSDGVTFSYVEVDGNKYEPNAVNDVAVSSSVSLYMVGMPKEWGTVKLIGASVPVYVETDMVTNKNPADVCRPPSCFVLAWINLTTACPAMYQKHGLRSYLFLAVRSGYMIVETAKFSCCGAQEIRLPLGSVYTAEVSVEWSPSDFIDIYLVNRFDAGSATPYLRIIENSTYYEQIARSGKVNGPLETATPGYSVTNTKVAIAVDKSLRSMKLCWYVWPMPSIYGSHNLWDEPWLWIADLWACGKTVRVDITPWLTEALKRNHRDISRGLYLDLLRFLYGEPTTYYWGSGDQYGAVSVHTDPRYDRTTADASGRVKLYHTTGIAPTDVATLIIIPAPYNATTIGGSDGSQPPPPPQLPKWLVFAVPTTACRTMFCTSLSPEVLGPLPPVAGDRALPNFGYSIMLMYIGEAGRHRVKVYVEDGYVISSGPPINVARAKNYKLVEIDKEWKPLEAVIAGPGWWVPYRRLGPCETMPVSASSIYATPDRADFVKIIVEDGGANFTYIIRVTDSVMYHISAHTPAPASLSTTPFDVTAYITLGGVPYYHAVYGYGEGGRLSPPACASTRFSNHRASQLFISGDFWGSFGLAHMPLKPVNIRYIYTKPRLELVEPWRGLVKVKADGPVAGFAFYAQRNGTWVKIGEVSTKVGNEYRGCVLVNVSKIYPWDPILVLPLVEQELDAAPGSTVAIWRPETALLFKTWADVVGYPKGARSELDVVRIC